MNTTDTIAAPATGVGGAVSIIRISGPDALTVGNALWRGRRPLARENARQLLYGKLDREPVLAVYMPGPHSYTGDDVVELQLHGSPLAVSAALQGCFRAGARPAEPGEFTFRAFVNGKLELTQAEAVGDLIAARSEQARKLAENQLAGRLGAALAELRERLLRSRAECESRLDFPEEELDWESEPETPVLAVRDRLRELAATAEAAQLWREGVTVVICGRPNAGKSSLLNALLGYDRAIVTEIPGTTRDTLEELVNLDGIPVRLTDTAGLREGGDQVEQLGMERSRRSLASAEVRFWVLDAATPERELECAELRRLAPTGNTIAVWNKLDCCPDPEALPPLPRPTVRISARTGAGLEELRRAFRQLIWQDGTVPEPELGVNRRHRALLLSALAELEPVVAHLQREEWELAAVGLRRALAELGRITGETADPDLLADIFSRFCIGK